MEAWRIVDGQLYVELLVSPRAARAKLGPKHGDRVKIFVTAPPVDGEANAAVQELLAKEAKVPAREVEIVAGQTSRRKTARLPVSEPLLAMLAALGLMVLVLLQGAVLGACFDERGTYRVALIESAEAPVLGEVVRLVVTIDAPARSYEAVRDADGRFALDIEVPADGGSGQIAALGYDGANALVAVGATPPVPWRGNDGELRIFMGAPETFATLPGTMAESRTDLAVTPALGGAALVGGRTADGAASAAVEIYSAFTHRVVALTALPEPRARAGAVMDAVGRLHVFGGLDDEGRPSASWWLLGGDGLAYRTLEAQAAWARVGPLVALSGRYAIAPGATPLLLDTEAGVAAPFAAASAVPALAGEVVGLPSGGALCVGQGCGEDGAVIVTLQRAAALAPRAMDDTSQTWTGTLVGHRLAVASDTASNAVYIAGGTDAETTAPMSTVWRGLVVEGDILRLEAVGELTLPRVAPAMGVVGPWLVVAGGFDPATDTPLASAELIEVAPPHAQRTVPLAAPRGGAALVVMGSGDALLVGGTTTGGTPAPRLELFVAPRYH